MIVVESDFVLDEIIGGIDLVMFVKSLLVVVCD